MHCPKCGLFLWQHGKYEKNVATEQMMVMAICIFRLYCPGCTMTFSLLTAFLKPRSCMLMTLFEKIIFSKVILKKTYAQVGQEFLTCIPGGDCMKVGKLLTYL